MAEFPRKVDSAILFMRRIRHQNIRDFLKKALAGFASRNLSKHRVRFMRGFLAGVFLFASTLGWAQEERLFSAGTGNNAFSSGPAKNSKLAAELRTAKPDFKELYKAVAICHLIEDSKDLDDSGTIKYILDRLQDVKNKFQRIYFTITPNDIPNEIIIEIPDEGMAVRYFDPTKANVITPYSDISKLSTKVIGPRLNRQIIHTVKALSAPKEKKPLSSDVTTLDDKETVFRQANLNIRTEKRRPRVLLVQSNISGLNNLMPPLGLYYLRASLRKFANAEVDIIDMGVGSIEPADIERRLKAKIEEFKPDIVGISLTTPTSGNAYKIARIIRKIKDDAVIVGGGAHVNAIPYHNIFGNAPFDCLIMGEGEIAFSQIVSNITGSGALDGLRAINGIALKHKNVSIFTGPADIIENLDALPAAHIRPEEAAQYDVWIVDKEHQAVPILTTRGCPYGCTFCSKAVFGRKVRKRSLENILREIRYYYDKGYPNFAFIDDAFGADPKRVSSFCDMLIASGLNKNISWRATIRTDVVNYDLLRKMKKAGCISLGFGIESGSQRILDKVVRKGTTVTKNLETIVLAKKAGIEEVRLFMMVGLPEETERDVRGSIEFVKKANPTNIGLSIAMPYPGSEWGNNPAAFRTTILNSYEHFLPYIKKGGTGKYIDEIPPIVHETASLNKERIARLYLSMRSELKDYMYDARNLRRKFILSKLQNAIGVIKETGLHREFSSFANVTNVTNLENIFARHIENILSYYNSWRALDRQSDLVWERLKVEYPESLADKAITVIVLLHLLAKDLGINIKDALTYFLSPKQLEIERGPPLLIQFDRLANCIHAAHLLKEGVIIREDYDNLLESYDNVITEKGLLKILVRLKDIGYLLSPDKVINLLQKGEEEQRFEAENLALIPMAMEQKTMPSFEHNEVIGILKPPTTTRTDGTINLELIHEIIKRLHENFGYEVRGIRILSGKHLSQHEEMLEGLYYEAFSGYMHGITSESVMRRVEEIYNHPDFERFFGCKFDRSMIIPAHDLVKKYGFTEDEVTAFWAPSRFPISVGDFERRYNVKVRIVDKNDLLGGLANGEVAIPRNLTLEEDGVLKIDWFEHKLPWGVNKVSQGTGVLAIVDPRVNNSRPTIVVNGYLPGLFDNFKNPDNKLTIAFLLMRSSASSATLKNIRENFLGDENMPDRNPKGTVRRDAFDGLFTIPEDMRSQLRGNNNLMHVSTSFFEVVKESMSIFGLSVEETAFGQLLLHNGYSKEQIEYLLKNPKIRRNNSGLLEDVALFALTNKLDTDKALEVVLTYFPPYRTDDAMATPSVSFEQHRKLIETASLAKNRLRQSQIKPASVRPMDIERLDAQERETCRLRGEELLDKGKVAVVIAAGGEGGRRIGYDVGDATLRDKIHNTILDLQIADKTVKANLAEIRVAHIKGMQQGRKRHMPVMIMGNDRNLGHIMQLWKEADFYGLDYLDLAFYSQNGIYRFNPSREDVLKSKNLIAVLKKNHELRIQLGLMPKGAPFDVHHTVTELIARNGDVGEFFRTDEGIVSTKPCGHIEMLIQPFINGTIASLAERDCEVLVMPNGDDMGFHLDPAKIGYFAKSGKEMMVTLVKMMPGEQGGVLVNADAKGNGVFKPQIIEKDNLPEGFDYSFTPNFNANQNYFNIPNILEFFLRGGSLEENLRRYYAMEQEERLRVVNERLDGIPFNYAIKPVRTGTDIAPDGKEVPKMGAAGQFERLIGSMTQVLTTEYMLVDRRDYGSIKTENDDQKSAEIVKSNISRRIPYIFSPKKRDSGQFSGDDAFKRYFDELIEISTRQGDIDEAANKCATSLQRSLYDLKNKPRLNSSQRQALFNVLQKTHSDSAQNSIASCIIAVINGRLILDVTKSELGLLFEVLSEPGVSKETKKTIALCIGWALRFNHQLLPDMIAALVKSDVATRVYITMAFEHAVTDKIGPKLNETDVKSILDILDKSDNTDEIRQYIASIMTFVLAHNPNLKLSDSQLKIVLDIKNRARWTEFVVEHALYNNPALLSTAISHIVDTDAVWIIEVVARHIRRSGLEIAKETIMLFANIAGQESKSRAFNTILEPLFFKTPNLFTAEVLKTLEKTYSKDVPEFKYLLFYASMEEIISSASIASLFPYQKRFKKLVSEGRKKVLVTHNIADGLGDELIRNSALIQALLDLNPELEVTLYTNRTFLYDHPRVKVKEIISHGAFASKDRFDLGDGDKFDMIIHHYDRKQRYSDSFEDKFRTHLIKHRPEIYINFDKSNDKFIPKEIAVHGKAITLSGFKDSMFMSQTKNVYIPTFRLCAELGLPFRYGTKKPKESLFTSLQNTAAETYWENVVMPANIDKRPIVIFNGFGGEDIKKGYLDGKESTDYYKTTEADFQEMLKKLVSDGFFVIVFPNDKWYGTPEVAKEFVNALSISERQHILIAPSSYENPKLHKNLIGHSDVAGVVTIEGAIMHLSYNVGVPFSVLLMEKSGYMLQWLPAGMDFAQGYSGLQYSDRVNRRDVIEGFVIPATITGNRGSGQFSGTKSLDTLKGVLNSDEQIFSDMAKNRIDYIDKHKKLFKDILVEQKQDILLRVPIEAIETVGVKNIKDFLATFQEAPNGYVELYYMSGIGEIAESVYQKYGLQKKSLPKNFKRMRENTVTLFPALKGEEIEQSTILSRLGSLDVTPEDTILSPIGLQNDPIGLIRAAILGLKMMDIAREVGEKGKRVIDQDFKDKIQLEILEQLKNVCDADDLKNFNLTPDDIIALATSTINNIIAALKKLIRLLPITPIDAEELRRIYEHAKEVLLAA